MAWLPRADGRGNEIAGVTKAQMDAYSTRAVQVHEKERELEQAWERKHGRAPTLRELLYIANESSVGGAPNPWQFCIQPQLDRSIVSR